MRDFRQKCLKRSQSMVAYMLILSAIIAAIAIGKSTIQGAVQSRLARTTAEVGSLINQGL